MLVYTCITDDYDSPRSDIKVINTHGPNPRFAAKAIKILGHKLGESSTIWCDGNIFIKDLSPFINLLKYHDIVVLKHPVRDCIYQEAEACKLLKLDYADNIDRQVKYYQSINYPTNSGLYACGIIARNHTAKINSLSKEWLQQITEFSCRDQISFPVVFKDVKIGVITHKTGTFLNNEIYEIKPHLKTIQYHDI